MAHIQYSGAPSPDAYPYETGYEQGYEHGYDQAAPAGSEASRVTQLINWAGALVSMGLVIGMAIWAFQLLVRDVADVPVIRALDSPMRVAPDDPGGAIAENQGLAVNRLAEGAEAAPVPDQLLLAPPPQDLSAVDLTPDAPTAQEQAPEQEQEQAFQNASTALPDIDAEILPDFVPEEDTDALIARLLQEETPLSDMDAPTLGEPAVDLVARAETVPLSVPGVRTSPRPAARPAGLSARAAAAAAAPAAQGVPAAQGIIADGITEDDGGFEIAAAELEAGTRLVQLGAFDTPALARAEWQRLSGNFPDFFLGRARVIEEAASGGATFYRLRAHGFGDLAASRRFCAALVAQGAACIPVTVR